MWVGTGLVVATATAVALAGSGVLGATGKGGPQVRSNPSGPAASGQALGAAASAAAVPTIAASEPPTPAPSPTITPAALLAGYQWPLTHARITAAYGPREGGIFIVDGQAFHDGVDVASFCGDHVRAAHDGVVLVAGRRVDRWIGWVGDVGPYQARLDRKNLWSGRAIMVIVDDGNGYRSVYMHLWRTAVAAGERVEAGDLIGYEGATGMASGCHLHYSIFDPDETAVFKTDPELVRRLKLPPGEVARIDPLDALPPAESVGLTWGWGARD